MKRGLISVHIEIVLNRFSQIIRVIPLRSILVVTFCDGIGTILHNFGS